MLELVPGEVEGLHHVGQGVDRGPGARDLALGEGMIRVVAVRRREVVLDDEAVEALLEHLRPSLGGVLGGSEARDLEHLPEVLAVATGRRAPRVGVLAGEAEVLQVIEADGLEVPGRVEVLDRPVELLGGELVLALACSRQSRREHVLPPAALGGLQAVVALGREARGG